MQKVHVWVGIGGDYCAFHEISFSIEYDITNDKQIGNLSLDELEGFNLESSDYSDYEIREAILLDGEYYVKW